MWYTGNGDSGVSTRFNSSRQEKKNSIFFEVLGSIDELNAYLGVVKMDAGEECAEELTLRQQDLFILQAELAGADKHITEKHVLALEERIDVLEQLLPLTTTFLLSGGVRLAAELDVARTIARRAERACVALVSHEKVSLNVLAYMNRLSSYFFALSRKAIYDANAIEEAPTY